MKQLLLGLALIGFGAHADEMPKRMDPHNIIASDADLDPVQKPTMSNVYATGTLYARPTRGYRNSGLIIKTDELHLIVGNFQDDNKYAGNTMEVSTKDPKIFDKVDALDQSKHYLFRYWYSYPLHFNMEDTPYKVYSVEESHSPSEFLSTGLPMGFDVKNGRVGHQTGPADNNGRMVDVFRWNTYILGRPICSFTLDSGGSKRTDDKPVANETTYNVYSEAGCKYLETILPYGLELKVTFTQSYLTIDGYDHTAEHVVVDKIPGTPETAAATPPPTSLLSDELLKDPKFQQGILDLIDKHWKQTHP